MGGKRYKYFAFVSYKSEDEKWAKWLQHKLEHYKLPTLLRKNNSELPQLIRPIFRDATDLKGGALIPEIQNALDDSRYLIVICSPRTVKSEYVKLEINRFIDSGRWKNIIPFIIEGTPNSGETDKECFPDNLRALHGDKELLGIDLKNGRNAAAVKVVAQMFGLDFDTLWKRHKREQCSKAAIISTIVPVMAAAFYYFAIPISMEIEIADDNHRLPMPTEAIVQIGGTQHRISRLDTTIRTANMPGSYRFRDIPIKFLAPYYNAIDTSTRPGAGLGNHMRIQLHRDSTFAIYSGKVMDSDRNPIGGTIVQVGDSSTLTDTNGCFKIAFQIKDQTEYKRISINKDGYKGFVRDDERPNQNLSYILL